MNKKLIVLSAILAVMVLILPQCVNTTAPVEENTDLVETTTMAGACQLSPAEFASWFSNGTVTANGMVNFANSLDSLPTSCDFYKWSWQMFLWITSPKDGSYVFDSPPFYDLIGSTLRSDGKLLTKVRGGKVDRDGQAGLVSGVLMSQKAGVTPDGSLVYYGIHVNDVYAYMASGQNTGQLKLETFPTTQAELQQIVDYAKNVYGVDIEDGASLTMELKSSWIQLPAGADQSRYATITADIPKYVKTSAQEWTWDGSSFEQDVTLALVGFHVVGSVAGHPEMNWATFEHTDNAPDANYFYVDNNGQVQEKQNFGADGLPVKKDWLFNNGSTKFNASNQMHMELESNNIVAEPSETISPSSTTRTHPWGNAPDSTSAANNTEIITLNENITGMLLDGDVRKNYYLVGATWTANGVPGVGEQRPDVRGSLLLSNSTMETYQQYKNCFTCHQGGNINGLSHIFGEIEPLPVGR